MNIITRASVKERIHVEQIIRSQPRMHNSGLVDIVTIPVRKYLGLSMDVYKPVGEVKEPLPIILDVHGGGLIAGRKEQNRNLGIQLARRGYIVFIPDYRLVPETNLFGQLGDLLKAFVVIHRCAERYGADMSRMYLVGDGAGAALACLVYALLWNPVSMQHLEDELPFDVPQEAKLSFKGVCLQNGILDLSSRKMNAIAPYLIEKDWKKTSYAECLSPKTYAKMLPPCLLVTSITDAHKRDTNQLAWQLKLKGTRYSVHSANNLFTKESFAARHPETRYAQAANTAMLAFFENK